MSATDDGGKHGRSRRRRIRIGAEGGEWGGRKRGRRGEATAGKGSAAGGALRLADVSADAVAIASRVKLILLRRDKAACHYILLHEKLEMRDQKEKKLNERSDDEDMSSTYVSSKYDYSHLFSV